jgi:hypothetical protein
LQLGTLPPVPPVPLLALRELLDPLLTPFEPPDPLLAPFEPPDPLLPGEPELLQAPAPAHPIMSTATDHIALFIRTSHARRGIRG